MKAVECARFRVSRRWAVGICGLLLLAVMPGLAQMNVAGADGGNIVPEGTRFIVVLGTKMESKDVKPGKHFKAKLGADLAALDGTRISRGSTLKGHLSIVSQGLHGRLLLVFDSIDTRHGTVPISASVVTVPGDRSVRVGKEGEIEKAGLSGTRVAEGAAAGAAAGAGTGVIAGGAHGAIIGAGVGAVVGGSAGALTDTNLRLEKGQQLELELDRPLQIPLS
jgi:hypothetical protein